MKHNTSANARELSIINIANFNDECIYRVQSQIDVDLSYIVRSNGHIVECTCPDYAKGHVCRHSCTVRRYEEWLRRLISTQRTVHELDRSYEAITLHSRKIKPF